MSQIVVVTHSALRKDAHYFAKSGWKCVILKEIVRMSLRVPWRLCVKVTMLPHCWDQWLGKEYMPSLYLNRPTLIARLIGPTWDNFVSTALRWPPCWAHEPCYLGTADIVITISGSVYGTGPGAVKLYLDYRLIHQILLTRLINITLMWGNLPQF